MAVVLAVFILWLVLGVALAARRGPGGLARAFPGAALTLVAVLAVVVWSAL